MKFILPFSFLLVSFAGFSQTSYEDSTQAFLKAYVQNHEVVKGHNKEHMQFYTVDKNYRVVADFKPSTSTQWLTFKTSGV
ncbi:MAG TPA: hypothetical protein VM871_03910 [Flavisolibacter sp.]|jgi:hypothetical protein|nr:hypothetical protein [Flavisolibacter sp.]